jgi:glycosyltransferase involved in cell wall biosynthesis
MRVKFINRGMAMFRGGGEQFDLNVAKYLKELDVDVSFLIGVPLFSKPKYPDTGFRTDYAVSLYLRDLALKMPRYTGSGKIMRFDIWAFERIAFNLLKKTRDVDIVQVCGLPALCSHISEELNIPGVLRAPGPGDYKYREKLKGCKAIVANGDAFKQIRKEIKTNLFDIPPGVNSEIFRPKESGLKMAYGVQNCKILLFVGRFVPLKNLPFLIDSFKEVLDEDKNIKLMLVGEGPLECKVRTRVKSHGITGNVIFTGRVPNSSLPEYYFMADALVLSSTYENFPNVVLEAMACELPIIAPRTGGIPTQIRHQVNGFLFENGKTHEFKEAIFNLINSYSLTREMGKRNREVVIKKYNWL